MPDLRIIHSNDSGKKRDVCGFSFLKIYSSRMNAPKAVPSAITDISDRTHDKSDQDSDIYLLYEYHIFP